MTKWSAPHSKAFLNSTDSGLQAGPDMGGACLKVCQHEVIPNHGIHERIINARSLRNVAELKSLGKHLTKTLVSF